MDAKETQRLLNAALNGTDEQLGILLERMRPRLVLWCASHMSADLRAHLEPDDAAQEILVAVHKDFRTYRGPASTPFFKWFFVIADHKLKDLVDFFGAKKRQKIEPVMSFTQTSPSQAVVRQEEIARMNLAIAQLPEDHRLVLRLYKLEGRDVEEVAQIMNRTANAVRILYCRALKELRRVLAPAAGGPDATR